MSICRARLRNTSYALRFECLANRYVFKTRLNSWIMQMIRQWISGCWSGDRKCKCKNSRLQTVNVMLITLFTVISDLMRTHCFFCCALCCSMWSSFFTTSHACVTSALCCRTFPECRLLASRHPKLVWHVLYVRSHAHVSCAFCCRTFPSVVTWRYNITCWCDVCFMWDHMLMCRVLYVAELSRVWSPDVTTSHAWTNSTCAKIRDAASRFASCCTSE